MDVIEGLFPPWPLLSAFVVASVILAVTPGPGVLFIVARSLTQGRRAGLATVAGVAFGNLGNAIGAAVGLGALFAVSSTAFLVAKYAGAAYLVYLGIKALRSRPLPTAGAKAAPMRSRQLFRDGFWVALLNPKTTIFFAAFLPQFMGADASPMLQGIVLGTLFVIIAAVTDSAYAVAAGTVAPALREAAGLRAAGRFLSGFTFIALGLLAAFAGTRGRT